MRQQQQVDVEEMLTALGIDGVSRHGDEVSFCCPFHGDHNPSASINALSTAWVCYGCHASGNAITLLARISNVSPYRARQLLSERYFAPPPKVPTGSMVDRVRALMNRQVREQDEDRPIPESIAHRYEVDWEMAAVYRAMGGEAFAGITYPFTRGFTVGTLTRLGFGYCPQTRRMTFQVRDKRGRLLGFKGRDVTGTSAAKYLVMQGDGFVPYKAAHVLYLANLLPVNAETVIVCEGELNAAKMHQHGFRNVVGISGSSLSLRQVELLRSLSRVREVVLFFDDDDAGRAGMTAAAARLSPYMRVRLVGAHNGDADSMRLDEIHTLIDSAKNPVLARIGA